MRGLTGMSYGRYFGELRPGEAFRHWPGRTINEYDDTLLSLLSMNQHPVHLDQHYAQNTQHGRRLVAGPTVISIVIGMTQLISAAVRSKPSAIPTSGTQGRSSMETLFMRIQSSWKQRLCPVVVEQLPSRLTLPINTRRRF